MTGYRMPNGEHWHNARPQGQLGWPAYKPGRNHRAILDAMKPGTKYPVRRLRELTGQHETGLRQRLIALSNRAFLFADEDENGVLFYVITDLGVTARAAMKAADKR